MNAHEPFFRQVLPQLGKAKLGVLCHPASVDDHLRHFGPRIMSEAQPGQVVCFFGPQHGIRGEKQDNMIESADFRDPVLNVPVYSLYGTTRQPTDEMFSQLDICIVDLQDIGQRVYTFISTLAYCMEAAARLNKKILVLDRPNPVGGLKLEGNYVEENRRSFVGRFALPQRHGCTVGELARLLQREFHLDCELDVVPLKGWKRHEHALEWPASHWVPPSPNIPTAYSAFAFLATVFLEGTNISEGRGTTKPFEWIGAPFIEPDALAEALTQSQCPGASFRPLYFQPTFHKWANEVCGGVQMHITDPGVFEGFWTGIKLLEILWKKYPEHMKWKKPPYEYEYKHLPIEFLLGSEALRVDVEKGVATAVWPERVEKDLAHFRKIRERYLLY